MGLVISRERKDTQAAIAKGTWRLSQWLTTCIPNSSRAALSLRATYENTLPLHPSAQSPNSALKKF